MTNEPLNRVAQVRHNMAADIQRWGTHSNSIVSATVEAALENIKFQEGDDLLALTEGLLEEMHMNIVIELEDLYGDIFPSVGPGDLEDAQERDFNDYRRALDYSLDSLRILISGSVDNLSRRYGMNAENVKRDLLKGLS